VEFPIQRLDVPTRGELRFGPLARVRAQRPGLLVLAVDGVDMVCAGDLCLDRGVVPRGLLIPDMSRTEWLRWTNEALEWVAEKINRGAIVHGAR